MKKVLLICFTFLFSASLFAQPDWFYKPPKKSGYFVFAGVGRGKSRRAAKNAALADVFSQIIYMINASITSNSTFEQYVEENEDDARKNSAVYKKVRAKGSASIENFEVMRQHVESEKVGRKRKKVFYILAKIPKSEVKKARKRIEAEREKMRKNPMGVFAVAVFPNKTVEEIDQISAAIQELYKTMGFNIKSVDIDFDYNNARSASKMARYIKEKAPELSKAIICIIKPSGIRKEKIGRIKIRSVLGSMTIRQINLKNSRVLSSFNIDSKGISMRRGKDAVEDAFRKLIKNLITEFLKNPAGEKKKDDDDYF